MCLTVIGTNSRSIYEQIKFQFIKFITKIFVSRNKRNANDPHVIGNVRAILFFSYICSENRIFLFFSSSQQGEVKFENNLY